MLKGHPRQQFRIRHVRLLGAIAGNRMDHVAGRISPARLQPQQQLLGSGELGHSLSARGEDHLPGQGGEAVEAESRHAAHDYARRTAATSTRVRLVTRPLAPGNSAQLVPGTRTTGRRCGFGPTGIRTDS